MTIADGARTCRSVSRTFAVLSEPAPASRSSTTTLRAGLAARVAHDEALIEPTSALPVAAIAAGAVPASASESYSGRQRRRRSLAETIRVEETMTEERRTRNAVGRGHDQGPPSACARPTRDLLQRQEDPGFVHTDPLARAAHHGRVRRRLRRARAGRAAVTVSG
jgi:hypothetical protein